MKRRLTLLSVLAVLIVSWVLLTGEGVAANIMSAQSFQAMIPYGVPEASDTSTVSRKNPAIYWGSDMDGTVTFSTGTHQNAYNSSCLPVIMLEPYTSDDTGDTVYSTHVRAISNTGFLYEVRKNANDTETDVTASVGIKWASFGWR